MLTDRQTNFYYRIEDICNSSKDLTEKEKKVLKKAIESINSGYDFKSSIKSMMIDLRYIQANNQIKYYLTEGGLSPDLQVLYNDLLNTYGKPTDEHIEKVLALTGSKIYTNLKGEKRIESLYSSSFGVINFLSWLLISFILIITLFSFNWLKMKLGVVGLSIFYIIGIGIGLLGISKQNKKNK